MPLQYLEYLLTPPKNIDLMNIQYVPDSIGIF